MRVCLFGSFSISWIAVALAQKSIAEHCQTIVNGLQSVNPTLAGKLTEKVLVKFSSHVMYDETFPVGRSGDTGVVGEEDDMEDAGAEQAATDDADPGEQYMASLFCRKTCLGEGFSWQRFFAKPPTAITTNPLPSLPMRRK